ncbi:YesK family protein [Oceanobacillus manasiensis]|uniref:YesK family protein n=1 Tax=Oceanobacillus manasiensis TaxID=586413 RepID=UPI0006947FB1|nr:YesK family protein [Oceanobacillus manasiensis]
MDVISQFIGLTFVIGIVIFVLSLLLKEKKIMLPIITSLLSMTLIVISFFKGGFGGMGKGYIGFSALIASIINTVLIAFIMSRRKIN